MMLLLLWKYKVKLACLLLGIKKQLFGGRGKKKIMESIKLKFSSSNHSSLMTITGAFNRDTVTLL